MTNETVTTDLSDFGYIELDEAGKILRAIAEKGYPENFSQDNVKLMFNKNSGFVFLTNDDCQVLMMNETGLELWYACPICGHEGFLEDMEHGIIGEEQECIDYCLEIGATEL